jgi:hypothetical protein
VTPVFTQTTSLISRIALPLYSDREDDAAWPKKNIVGKQELEVRIDNEHISFEVSLFSLDQVATGNWFFFAP